MATSTRHSSRTSVARLYRLRYPIRSSADKPVLGPCRRRPNFCDRCGLSPRTVADRMFVGMNFSATVLGARPAAVRLNTWFSAALLAHALFASAEDDQLADSDNRNEQRQEQREGCSLAESTQRPRLLVHLSGERFGDARRSPIRECNDLIEDAQACNRAE